ncbi:MAG: hypothetical protein ACQESD_06970 [Thermoplasmatota archaeon]
MKGKLLRLGYSRFGGDKPIELDISLPEYIEEKQKDLGRGKIKEVATR